MSVADEVVALEESLKRAKFKALECRTSVKKCADQIVNAKRRLESITKNLNSCKAIVKRELSQDTVTLYQEDDGKPGEYLKAKKLIEQNKELVDRVKAEINRLTFEMKEHEEAVPMRDAEVRSLEGKLKKYGVVVKGPWNDRS